MLYKDWDIVLTGEHIRITPITTQDEVPYSRLMKEYNGCMWYKSIVSELVAMHLIR